MTTEGHNINNIPVRIVILYGYQGNYYVLHIKNQISYFFSQKLACDNMIFRASSIKTTK